MEIRVNEEDQLRLLEELRHLRKQCTELQEAGTRNELERREFIKIIRRTNAYELPKVLTNEQLEEERRLKQRWIAITSGVS